VPVNTTTQFVATVNLSNSSTTTNTTVTWQVNGVAGGNSTTGAIAPSTTDVQVGIYTAPAVAPGGTDNGQVDVTAVATQIDTGTSTTTTTVTSNTAVVTVGAGTGLAITPTTTTVPARGSHQFAATLNSVADPMLHGRSVLLRGATSARSIRRQGSTMRHPFLRLEPPSRSPRLTGRQLHRATPQSFILTLR
jgi:hypothetical protein